MFCIFRDWELISIELSLGKQIKPQIGWYVGYLEKEKNAYFFATNIDADRLTTKLREKIDSAAD